MRKVFTILGYCMLALWVIFYWFTSELDCAFAPRSTCGHSAPWAMRGDDFLYFVLLPGLITVGLFLIAWWAGRNE